jgi:DNA-directed RNA polymerase subunit RPC12/RpoP
MWKRIFVNKGYNKKDMEILAGIWDKTHNNSMKCPECGGKMVLIQVEPINDAYNAYIPYDTIIECTHCDFKIRAESFTILGSIKEFDTHNVEIGSWSPSGSRVLSKYEHILDYELLKNLKKSGELVEFLIVNNQAIQVIG